MNASGRRAPSAWRGCGSDPPSVDRSALGGIALARAMAAAIDPSRPGPVVQLGPGRGAVTAALVERGVHPSRLVLIEADPTFCALLRGRWPWSRVLQTDPCAAPILMRSLEAPAAAIVAGLPLLLRPPAQRLRLLLGCLRCAAPGAPFVQVTWFPCSPIPLPRPGLVAAGSPIIWRHLWPTRVWTYRIAGDPCRLTRSRKARRGRSNPPLARKVQVEAGKGGRPLREEMDEPAAPDALLDLRVEAIREAP
jgi:phosphatidylethanolamine/phosphatidyl-N-methylethanolamine N-methyltransferase